MFESRSPWILTEEAEKASFRQKNYLDCWKGLPKGFKGGQSKLDLVFDGQEFSPGGFEGDFSFEGVFKKNSLTVGREGSDLKSGS